MSLQNYYQPVGYFCLTILIEYFLLEDLATFLEPSLSPEKLLEFQSKIRILQKITNCIGKLFRNKDESFGNK